MHEFHRDKVVKKGSEIFDLHGTKVKPETINGRYLRSKVHGLSSGMYFYTISSDSQVRRGKLVKGVDYMGTLVQQSLYLSLIRWRVGI